MQFLKSLETLAPVLSSQINEERRRGKEFIEDSADALSLFCTSVIYNFKYVGDGGTKIISVQIIY